MHLENTSTPHSKLLLTGHQMSSVFLGLHKLNLTVASCSNCFSFLLHLVHVCRRWSDWLFRHQLGTGFELQSTEKVSAVLQFPLVWHSEALMYILWSIVDGRRHLTSGAWALARLGQISPSYHTLQLLYEQHACTTSTKYPCLLWIKKYPGEASRDHNLWYLPKPVEHWRHF